MEPDIIDLYSDVETAWLKAQLEHHERVLAEATNDLARQFALEDADLYRALLDGRAS